MLSDVRAILVPTDFSETADAAVAAAEDLAREWGAELTLLNVFETPYVLSANDVTLSTSAMIDEMQKENRRELATRVEQIKGRGVAAKGVFRAGIAAAEITGYAQEAKPDLVVMGTHGRTGWKHALLGSVAERVIQRARVPVLVIPQER